MMMAGSFHGTRTMGTVSVCEMACSIGQSVLMSVNPWDTESQPIVTHVFSRHICLTRLGRTVTPRVVDWPVGPAPQKRSTSGRRGEIGARLTGHRRASMMFRCGARWRDRATEVIHAAHNPRAGNGDGDFVRRDPC